MWECLIAVLVTQSAGSSYNPQVIIPGIGRRCRYAWPATGSPSYLTNSSSHLVSHQPLIINWFLPSTFEDHLIIKSPTSDDHQNLMTKLWPSLPQLTRLLSDHLGWSSTRTTLRYVKLSTSFSHYFQHNFLMTIILILFHPRYNLRQEWLGSSWTSPKKPVEALFPIVSIAMQWIVSIATAIRSLTHLVIVLSLADLRGLQVCLYSSDAVPINLNAIWPSERPIEGMCLSSTSVLKVAWMGLDGSLGLLLTLPPTSRIWTTFRDETSIWKFYRLFFDQPFFH